MKEDAPPPTRPPRKRRQLELVPDLWLAVWLDERQSPDLSMSDRRRVQSEKDRRKRIKGRAAIIIGFLGTRSGLTPAQRRTIRTYLTEYATPDLINDGLVEAHHTDEPGAAQQFHNICLSLGIPVVLHPAEGEPRAHCEGAIRTEKIRPATERDKELIQAATRVLAAPKETSEQETGIWPTIRYARWRGHDLMVILPNGRDQEETRATADRNS